MGQRAAVRLQRQQEIVALRHERGDRERCARECSCVRVPVCPRGWRWNNICAISKPRHGTARRRVHALGLVSSLLNQRRISSSISPRTSRKPHLSLTHTHSLSQTARHTQTQTSPSPTPTALCCHNTMHMRAKISHSPLRKRSPYTHEQGARLFAQFGVASRLLSRLLFALLGAGPSRSSLTGEPSTWRPSILMYTVYAPGCGDCHDSL